MSNDKGNGKGTADKLVNTCIKVDDRTPTLKEVLMQSVRETGSIGAIRANINEAKEAAAPEVMKLFAEIIEWGDRLGVEKTLKVAPRETKEEAEQAARANWLKLSWKDWEEKMREFAQYDPGAKAILEKLEPFCQNKILRDTLWQTITEIERPSRGVSGFMLLGGLLEELVKKSLAQKIPDPRVTPPNGIVTRNNGGRCLYLPAKGIQISALGWQFIKAAEGRAQGRAEEKRKAIEELRKKADEGITPLNARSKKKTCFFLWLGKGMAILIEVKTVKKTHSTARVTEGVGIPRGINLPSKEIPWDPEGGFDGEWPLREIPGALRALADVIQPKETSNAEPQMTTVTAGTGAPESNS